MRKVAIFLLYSVLAFALISCSAGITGPEHGKNEEIPEITTDPKTPVLASLSLEFSEFKNLEVVSPADIDRVEYRAIPLFETPEVEAGLVGNQPNWTEITPDGYGRVNLGYFTQGHWHVYVRCFNPEGSMIYTGDCDVYLRKGGRNLIEITLSFVWEETALSSLDVSFTTTEIVDEGLINAHPIARMFGIKDGQIISSTDLPFDWTKESIENGQIRISGRLENLPQGRYMMSIDLYRADGKFITGQAVNLTLVAASETVVRGALEGGEYTESSFKISEDLNEFSGNLIVTGGSSWRKGNTGNDDITFLAQKKDGNTGSIKYSEHADRIEVYIDSEPYASYSPATGETPSIPLNPSSLSYGLHLIDVIVYRRFAGVDEKAAKQTMRLYVMDEVGYGSGYGG